MRLGAELMDFAGFITENVEAFLHEYRYALGGVAAGAAFVAAVCIVMVLK